MIRFILTSICNCLLDFAVGFLVTSHPEWNPRAWSNKEIFRYGKYFNGHVVNISAAADSDKCGKFYRNYFPNASSYSITNYGFGEDGSGSQEEYILDLTKHYDGSLGKIDVVLNHTVIEHINSVPLAIDNLCKISSDVIITVVPFIQMFHGRIVGYSDYWRYTPMSLINEFASRGFSTLYLSWNKDHALTHVYILHIASKHPEKYCNIFRCVQLPVVNCNGPGVNFTKFIYGHNDKKKNNIYRRIGELIGCRVIPDINLPAN